MRRERDLRISFSYNLKCSKQRGIADLKANRILGLMIGYTKLIVPPYKSLVRPHLEYWILAQRPHCKKDMATDGNNNDTRIKSTSHEHRLK